MNVSATPITSMGCRQCLPLNVVQLRGKHCRKPHCRNGVVDMFGQGLFRIRQESVLLDFNIFCLISQTIISQTYFESWKLDFYKTSVIYSLLKIMSLSSWQIVVKRNFQLFLLVDLKKGKLFAIKGVMF